MIDIIITASENQNKESLTKTLLSICGQSICNQLICNESIKDKLKIYVENKFLSEDNLSDIEKFKEKISIQVVNDQVINYAEGNYINSIIDKTENKYVMFIEMGDMFYNCFSLEYLYNEIINKEADICIGLVVENEQGQYKYLEENNYEVFGKIYSKESFRKNEDKIKVNYLSELIYLHNL